jgi:HSP20 family molecular chaperone IbpA
MATTVARRGGGPVAEMLHWLETNTGIGAGGIGLAPYVHVEDFVEEGTYVLRAELPGIDPDQDVEVKIEGDQLIIHGERREEEKDKNHREFHYGAFSRSVPLPAGVKPEDITATYKDGVLEVRVPAKPEPAHAAVTIPIQRSAG